MLFFFFFFSHIYMVIYLPHSQSLFHFLAFFLLIHKTGMALYHNILFYDLKRVLIINKSFDNIASEQIKYKKKL